MSVEKSKSLREDFILDYIKICTLADIPLEKTEKLKPFLLKHCKQGGAIPQAKFLCTEYIPRLFDEHFHALKSLVTDTPVGIVADETTDIRDHCSDQGKPLSQI